jgi:hypothetical protein
MGPADSRRITRVPRYSGYRYGAGGFAYGAITLCGPAFRPARLSTCAQRCGPTTPEARCHAPGLGSSPVARHYWGNHCLFSLPAGTKMFQFPAFASPHLAVMTSLQDAGLSHSEIVGSMVICTCPTLIAAYHVLHRLNEPRHPPSALSYFLFDCPPCRYSNRQDGRAHTSAVFLFFRSDLARNGLQSCLCQYVKDRRACLSKHFVENNGFEPLTPCLQSRCSSQLS